MTIFFFSGSGGGGMAPGALGGGGGIMDCEEGRGGLGGLADAAWGVVLPTFCRMRARICVCVGGRESV